MTEVVGEDGAANAQGGRGRRGGHQRRPRGEKAGVEVVAYLQ